MNTVVIGGVDTGHTAEQLVIKQEMDAAYHACRQARLAWGLAQDDLFLKTEAYHRIMKP